MTAMTAVAWIAANALAVYGWGRVFRGHPARERGYLALHAALLGLALASLALARLGQFHALGAALLAAVPPLLLRARPIAAPPESSSKALPAVLGAMLLLNALFPTYYLLGGRDPGIYLLSAVRVARAGGVDFDLRPHWLAQVPEHWIVEPGEGYYYLGLYSARQTGDAQAAPGSAVAQFLHLYPSLAAHGFAAAGLEGLVRVNALIAALALWSVARLARPWCGPGGAALIAALLGLSPAWIHAARITMPEILSAAIALFGFELSRLAWRERSGRLAFGAGLAGGLGQLCRLDSAIWVLAVAGFALAAAPRGPAARRLAAAMLVGFALGFALGAADGWTFSRPYLAGQWHHEVLRWPLRIVAACGLAAALLAGPAGAWVPARAPRLLASAGAIALAAWLAWCLLGRRWLWPESFDARAAWELGWYAAPWGLALAAAGALRLARRLEPPDAALLALAGGALFAYTWRPGIFADHPWASRRWVPFALPLVAILAGAAVGMPRQHGVRRLVAGLAAATTTWFLVLSWPFLGRSLLRELPAGYAPLVAYLEGRGPAVALRGELAPVLTYYWDRPVLQLHAAGREALARGELDGYTLIGLTPWHVDLGTAELRGGIQATQLEARVGAWPRLVFGDTYCLDAGPISAQRRPLDLALPAAHPSLITRCGRRDGEALASSGAEGVLVGGPYIRLEPGHYEVCWFGALEREASSGPLLGELRVDGQAASAPHSAALLRRPLRRGELVPGAPASELGRLELRLDEAHEAVELVVAVRKRVWLRVTRVALRRLEPPR